jgi:hypothetical protein
MACYIYHKRGCFLGFVIVGFYQAKSCVGGILAELIFSVAYYYPSIMTCGIWDGCRWVGLVLSFSFCIRDGMEGCLRPQAEGVTCPYQGGRWSAVGHRWTAMHCMTPASRVYVPRLVDTRMVRDRKYKIGYLYIEVYTTDTILYRYTSGDFGRTPSVPVPSNP